MDTASSVLASPAAQRRELALLLASEGFLALPCAAQLEVVHKPKKPTPLEV